MRAATRAKEYARKRQLRLLKRANANCNKELQGKRRDKTIIKLLHRSGQRQKMFLKRTAITAAA